MRTTLLFILTGFLILCGCSSEAPSTASAAAPPSPPATTSAPAQKSPVGDFVAVGPLTVEHQVDVTAERDGLIAELLADTGTPVTKGQLLARLDDRQLIAARDAARAKYLSITADLKNWQAGTKVTEADYQRAKEMWKDNLITQQQLEHAKYQNIAAGYEAQRQEQEASEAEAALKAAELELAKTRVVAPFDGMVARRYVRAGQYVAQHDRLFWVSAIAPLRVRFMLPEKLLDHVHKGTALSIVPVALPDQHRSAKVVIMSPVVDPGSGSLEVIAEVQGPTGDLRPGMTVEIRLAGQP